MEELLLGKSKDVRNISEYFSLVSFLYDGSNRSCHKLICISLSHVISHVLSHVMSHVMSHVLSYVMSHVLSHVMSQSKSHVKSHSCKSHS